MTEAVRSTVFNRSDSIINVARIQQRTEIVNLHAEGLCDRVIAWGVDCHLSTVRRWKEAESGQLADRPRSGRPPVYNSDVRKQILGFYCQTAPDGCWRWTLETAEAHLRHDPGAVGLETAKSIFNGEDKSGNKTTLSRSTIHRILIEHAMYPHRYCYYLAIMDPEFFPKMQHVIQLYGRPLNNLFLVDECTSIQAVSRPAPDMLRSTDGNLKRDSDYVRHGVTHLFGFMDHSTGRVFARCRSEHDTSTLVEVFSEHVANQPDDEPLHYLMDNYSPHFNNDFCKAVAQLSGVDYVPLKTGAERREWLQSEHKRIVIHFLPFHASWLNMIESWFGILKKKCLKGGWFDSVPALVEAIYEFVQFWNREMAHPFKWRFDGSGLQAKVVRSFNKLLFSENSQVDSKFLARQLLLIGNIRQSYRDEIPHEDWEQFEKLFCEKHDYMQNIIDNEPGPHRRRRAQEALDQATDFLMA